MAVPCPRTRVQAAVAYGAEARSRAALKPASATTRSQVAGLAAYRGVGLRATGRVVRACVAVPEQPPDGPYGPTAVFITAIKRRPKTALLPIPVSR